MEAIVGAVGKVIVGAHAAGDCAFRRPWGSNIGTIVELVCSFFALGSRITGISWNLERDRVCGVGTSLF